MQTTKKRNLKPLIKKLYIDQGFGVEDICVRLNCDRGTFYYHKKKDKELGVDWDEIKAQKEFNAISSNENFQKQKELFLTSLFNAFEKEKDTIYQIQDPSERIAKLNAFANNYYKFLKPSVHDCKGVASQAATFTLNVVIDFAVKYEKRELIDFLTEHFDAITVEVINELKKAKK